MLPLQEVRDLLSRAVVLAMWQIVKIGRLTPPEPGEPIRGLSWPAYGVSESPRTHKPQCLLPIAQWSFSVVPDERNLRVTKSLLGQLKRLCHLCECMHVRRLRMDCRIFTETLRGVVEQPQL